MNRSDKEDQIFEVYTMLISIGQSPKEAYSWITTPTEYWWKDSPLDVISRGDGDRVIKMLKEQI